LNYFIVFFIIYLLIFFNFGNFREFGVDIIPEELKNEPEGTFLEPNEEYFAKQFYPGILGIYSFEWRGIGIIKNFFALNFSILFIFHHFFEKKLKFDNKV